MTPGDDLRSPFIQMFESRSVGALITTADGRYLMQLRDDNPHVDMEDNWGLFGGWTKPNEAPEQSLQRELEEELDFTPMRYFWFTEIAYLVPHVERPPIHKTFFDVPIEVTDLDRMTQAEGAGMKLFKLSDLMRLENLLPWDVCAVMAHARQEEIRHLHHGRSTETDLGSE